MKTERERAAKLKREVESLRAKRNDPATPKAVRRVLKMQIETKIWMGQRLDHKQFKTYRWRSSLLGPLRPMRGFGSGRSGPAGDMVFPRPKCQRKRDGRFAGALRAIRWGRAEVGEAIQSKAKLHEQNSEPK